MALEIGDVKKTDPPPPPIAGDDASPEVSTTYRDPNIPDPSLSPVSSIVSSLTPDVPDVLGGTYGDVPATTNVASDLTLPFIPPGFTKEQIDKLRKTNITILDEQIGERERAQRDLDDKDREFERKMKRLNAAIGHDADNLHPWNADWEMAARKHDLWEQFGSPGLHVAMIGSAFTAMPMVSALNAGAAAMNAINQGDIDGYDKAFDAWKQNTELVLKRMRVEQDEFNNIDKLRNSNLTRWREELALKMDQFGDRRKRAMLDAGLDDEVIKAIKAQEDLYGQIETNYKDHLKNKALFDEVQRQLEINGGNFFAAYTEAAKKLNEAEYAGRYGQSLTAQQQAKINERQTQWDAANPPKADESTDDYNKRREAAHDDITRQVVTSYHPLEERKLNLGEWKAQEDKRHHEATEAVSQGKLSVDQARQQEDARHKQVMDDIAAGRLAKEVTAEVEKERHDKAMEEIQKLSKTQLTPNKAAELRIASDRYRTGIETIDKLLSMIQKHVGAVGAAGYATRAAESMSNVIAGSNATDRKEIERLINELQMLTPRLITESTSRPMASEHEHVSSVVGGLRAGDTRPNVLRNLQDLRGQLVTIKGKMDDII